MSYFPTTTLGAARSGRQPVSAFNELFSPLKLLPPSAGQSVEAAARDQALGGALHLFNADVHGHVANSYILSGDNPQLANGPPNPGTYTFFVPYPHLSDKKTKVRVVAGQECLYLRMDAGKGSIVSTMNEMPYFQTCAGLYGNPPDGAKYVWLTRAIAEDQFIMVPYTPSSVNVHWSQERGPGGSSLAEAKTEVGEEFIVPNYKDSVEVNKTFWAMMFGGIKEEDPIAGRMMHSETPAPRAELSDSEVIDKAVVAFTKMKDAVAGPFTAESRDEPAKDKPSAIAEVAGAVAVAAGVALATGVVAALV